MTRYKENDSKGTNNKTFRENPQICHKKKFNKLPLSMYSNLLLLDIRRKKLLKFKSNLKEVILNQTFIYLQELVQFWG